jgi:hypothetical protein
MRAARRIGTITPVIADNLDALTQQLMRQALRSCAAGAKRTRSARPSPSSRP